MIKKHFWLVLICVLMLAVACGPSDDDENTPQNTPDSAGIPTVESTSAPDNTDSSSYPAPTEIDEAYPAPEDDSQMADAPYPAPRATPNEEKRFTLDVIKVGQETISGTGYPNTAIKIVSVSHAGEVLGFASVHADRTFTVDISRPIEEREFIGIQLGDQVNADSFSDAPGTDIPMIGLVLDQRLSEP